jgi:hypothetical protein
VLSCSDNFWPKKERTPQKIGGSEFRLHCIKCTCCHVRRAISAAHCIANSRVDRALEVRTALVRKVAGVADAGSDQNDRKEARASDRLGCNGRRTVNRADRRDGARPRHHCRHRRASHGLDRQTGSRPANCVLEALFRLKRQIKSDNARCETRSLLRLRKQRLHKRRTRAECKKAKSFRVKAQT